MSSSPPISPIGQNDDLDRSPTPPLYYPEHSKADEVLLAEHIAQHPWTWMEYCTQTFRYLNRLLEQLEAFRVENTLLVARVKQLETALAIEVADKGGAGAKAMREMGND